MKQKLKEIPSGPFALGQEASLMKRNHQYFGIFLSSYLHHHKHGLHAEQTLDSTIYARGIKIDDIPLDPKLNSKVLKNKQRICWITSNFLTTIFIRDSLEKTLWKVSIDNHAPRSY